MSDISADVIIIGAGASGLATAAELAPSGKKIIILEAQILAGRKILVSGNGRCNFTNEAVSPSKYYGDEGFIKDVLKDISPKYLLDFFDTLGLFYTSENGRYFPLAGKASSVQQCFLNYLDNYNTAIFYGEAVKEINPTANLWCVKTATKEYTAKYIVLSCGSCAYPQAGGTKAGYLLAKNLGHTVTSLRPALSGLNLKEKAILRLAGLKIQARVWLAKNQKDTEQDEIIFTARGVSGNNILSLSRQAEEGETLIIDFLPTLDKEKLNNILLARAQQFKTLKIKCLFSGLLPDTLSNLLIDFIGLKKNAKLVDLSASNFAKIVSTLKGWPFTVGAPRTFEDACVACGGVDTEEVCAKTLASKKAKNVFITGELLNIDGRCGGYNLHFAFATGILAAKSIKKEFYQCKI